MIPLICCTPGHTAARAAGLPAPRPPPKYVFTPSPRHTHAVPMHWQRCDGGWSPGGGGDLSAPVPVVADAAAAPHLKRSRQRGPPLAAQRSRWPRAPLPPTSLWLTSLLLTSSGRPQYRRRHAQRVCLQGARKGGCQGSEKIFMFCTHNGIPHEILSILSIHTQGGNEHLPPIIC